MINKDNNNNFTATSHLLRASSFILASLLVVLITTVKETTAEKDQCTLYMAPSSSLGPDVDEYNQRLSMYAGVHFKPGQIIGRPEIAIPLIHLDEHNGFSSSSNNNNNNRPEFFETVENFAWNSATVSAQYEATDPNSLVICIPGVGALGNQHPTLVYNADWDPNANIERTSITTQTQERNPGRGSTSHYYDMTLMAQDEIPVGMEILVNDLGLEQDSSLHTMEDFAHADKSLKQINEFMKKHDSTLSSNRSFFGSNKKQKIYEFLLKDVLHEEENDLFPDNVEDIHDSGSFLQTYPELQKSISWLEENGQCIDGIYVKESTTVPGQYGAFATRSFKKGDVVAPSPLMMIPEKSYLDIYKLYFLNKRIDKSQSVLSQQLIMNYSFGHSESSLLFYPYGVNVNYINHQSSRGGKEGENVKLVWTKAKYHQSEFLEYTPDNLRVRDDDDVIFRLGMDIVAMRDIEADEEIFLDYGVEWETKWNDHVQNWNDDDDEDKPMKALELNSMMKESSPDYAYFYTSGENDKIDSEGKKLIPDKILTSCYLTWEELEDDDEILLDTKKPTNQDWFKFNKNTIKAGYNLFQCTIIDRHELESDHETKKEYEYTVSIPHDGGRKVGFVFNVPQSFIKYIDEPYTSHIHSIEGFRHYIGIPDDIFPQTWRDLKA